MSAKGEKMKEFLGIYQVARRQYDLRMHVKKSIYEDCCLTIYQGEKTIIRIKDENEESMYNQATRELKQWIKNHAQSSAKKGAEEDGENN